MLTIVCNFGCKGSDIFFSGICIHTQMNTRTHAHLFMKLEWNSCCFWLNRHNKFPEHESNVVGNELKMFTMFLRWLVVFFKDMWYFMYNYFDYLLVLHNLVSNSAQTFWYLNLVFYSHIWGKIILMSSKSDWVTKWDQCLKGWGVDSNIYVSDHLRRNCYSTVCNKEWKVWSLLACFTITVCCFFL